MHHLLGSECNYYCFYKIIGLLLMYTLLDSKEEAALTKYEYMKLYFQSLKLEYILQAIIRYNNSSISVINVYFPSLT